MDKVELYEALRAAIASGEIQPHTRLVESDIMARFSAERPSVRVALVRLEQEGLVEQEKNRSARVRLVERDEALEIYRARALLESHAAGLAAAKITPEQIDRLDELIRQSEAGSPADVAAFETQFHQSILDIAGDRTVARLCGSLHGHLLRYHHYTKLVHDWSADSPCEHRYILDALRAGDSAAASAAMRAHLDRLTAILERILDGA